MLNLISLFATSRNLQFFLNLRSNIDSFFFDFRHFLWKLHVIYCYCTSSSLIAGGGGGGGFSWVHIFLYCFNYQVQSIINHTKSNYTNQRQNTCEKRKALRFEKVGISFQNLIQQCMGTMEFSSIRGVLSYTLSFYCIYIYHNTHENQV